MAGRKEGVGGWLKRRRWWPATDGLSFIQPKMPSFNLYKFW
jgi:hypothetical protein